MSIDVMSAVWKLKDLADSEMLVLLAMADWADRDGVCWPSVAQLADKTNKGERTIQGAIKAIVVKGHLTRIEVPGRGCRYIIHPRSGCTPAASYQNPRSGCAQYTSTHHSSEGFAFFGETRDPSQADHVADSR